VTGCSHDAQQVAESRHPRPHETDSDSDWKRLLLMATTLGLIVIGAFLGLAIMQSVFVAIHCRFVSSQVAAKLDDAFQPHVAVILCLRGHDPSLAGCLEGLTRQAYRPFTIHVVVDDAGDSALDAAKSFFDQHSLEVRYHVLKNYPPTCSLKCSALVAAVTEIDNSADVIALVDADTVPDEHWLGDLIAPLADPEVGASTGNRWFAPKHSTLGAEVRKAWNAAAVAQMSFYTIPWGGSLALRRATILQCGLLEKWNQAFCEDTMLTDVLKDNKLRVVRVPNLILANDESTNLSGAFHWIVRQLITVRLYHHDWSMILTHGVMSGTVLIAAVISIPWLLLVQEYSQALSVLGSLAAFQVCNTGLLAAIENANVQAVASRGASTAEPAGLVDRLKAIFVTQLVYPAAITTAACTQQISWRKIDYAIRPGKQIEMLGYSPYEADHDESSESIG
jgi:hypothetical protein